MVTVNSSFDDVVLSAVEIEDVRLAVCDPTDELDDDYMYNDPAPPY